MTPTDALKENRHSFFERLRPLFAPSLILKLELAYTLAKFYHRAQFRKEKDVDGSLLRYFEHLRRAALILIDEVRCLDYELIIALLLHDSLEDTELSDEMIEYVFGTRVTNIVIRLSKIPPEGYHERLAHYTNWEELLCKACDRLDNLRSINETTVEFRRKQVEETETHYFPLFDKLIEICPPTYRTGAQWIRDEVRKRVIEIRSALPQE